MQNHQSVSNVVNDIIQSFCTRKHKREQPDNLWLLGQFLQNKIHQQKPIEFVMYRGIGERTTISNNEITWIKHLTSMLDRVRSVYDSWTIIHIVFTDTHGMMNNYSHEHIYWYYESLKNYIASQTWYTTQKLSSLREKSPTPNDKTIPKKEESISSELLQELIRWAKRHYQTQHISDTEVNRESIARNYYSINQYEKRIIENYFSESIFLTYNNSNHRSLFPDSLPIFYMYSLKKWYAEKPRFTTVCWKE